MWQYNQTSELSHHGILGMRWGHRTNRTNRTNQTNQTVDTEKIKKREEHKQFRADVKQAKRHGLAYDAFGDTTTFKNTALDQFYNSKNQKIGQEYAMKVITRAKKEQLVTEMAVTVMGVVGANYASHKLGLH